MRAIAELTEERIQQYIDNADLDKWTPTREAVEQDAREQVWGRERHWEKVIPSRFQDARTDDLDGSLSEAVTEWCDDPGRNLVFLGSVGTGKTHAAAAATRLAIMDGWKAAFYPVVDLLDALRPNNDDGFTLEHCKTIELLVLDDLGAERPTDWTAERLYSLVNARWLEQRPIIVTSNLSASGGKGPFVDAVGPRMYSRLVDGAVVAQTAGADRRRS